MIKAAEMLFRAPEAEKPTILLMIDRNELEDQMLKNLAALGLGNLEHAYSIDRLNKLLRDDYRGIIVTMIHKFRDMPANLNMRSNIYVLIDEAHRTTGGDLGNFLMAGLPNASYIGFTGTPVDKTVYGKGTFKTFGCEDDKGYLHKYSIADSIEDGTTLPLFYDLAQNEMLVPHEVLDKEFLSLAEAEGVADIEELNKILDRAVNLKNFLKGKERIRTGGSVRGGALSSRTSNRWATRPSWWPSTGRHARTTSTRSTNSSRASIRRSSTPATTTIPRC